jgi:NhaP-type Na+/H+ or K+/H+ antiporter
MFFALLIFAFGLFSQLTERISVTGPMFFMTVGILASSLGLLDVTHELGPVKLVTELALMLVLFIDATLIDFRSLRRVTPKVPMRLLLIGLPITMLFGTGLGVLMFDSVGIWAVVLMALILLPTDAALGQAVVKSEDVSSRIRQSTSVENGLNDGIALPPILLCMALLGAEAGDHEDGWLGFRLGLY